MNTTKEEKLPLGAVRTADGEVVVPASRRADGSTRKPIRIRKGYVPQDEVPKYKTVAQRRREQEAKRAAEAKAGGDTAVDELLMGELSLEQKKEPPTARTSGRAPREERVKDTETATDASSGDQQQQLKRQLTKINKQLKEIAKLENADDDALTTQQKQKVTRKATLQQQRNEIIAELNGATVTRSSGSTTGPHPKVAISL